MAAAIRRHPQWLGGTRRDVTALVAGVPGLIAKDGAEGVYAAALPDGRAVALKIDDGGQRARPPVMAGRPARPRRGRGGARRLRPTTPLLGGGQPVGEVRRCLTGPRDLLAESCPDLTTCSPTTASGCPPGHDLRSGGPPATVAPFLLVHGLSSNARVWDGVARRLAAAGHEVVAVDLRGHGRSEAPADGYDTDTCADDLRCVAASSWA